MEWAGVDGERGSVHLSLQRGGEAAAAGCGFKCKSL